MTEPRAELLMLQGVDAQRIDRMWVDLDLLLSRSDDVPADAASRAEEIVLAVRRVLDRHVCRICRSYINQCGILAPTDAYSVISLVSPSLSPIHAAVCEIPLGDGAYGRDGLIDLSFADSDSEMSQSAGADDEPHSIHTEEPAVELSVPAALERGIHLLQDSGLFPRNKRRRRLLATMLNHFAAYHTHCSGHLNSALAFLQAARRIERDNSLEGDQDDAEPGSPVPDSVCAPEAVLRQLLDKLRTARSKDSVRDPVYPRSPRVRLLSPGDVAAWLDRDRAEARAATKDQISLARTHRNLASVLSRMQRHCSARAHLMQAVALLESVLTDALERRKGKYTADQDENEDPESSHAAALLVAALFAQGAEEERLRAYDEAERTYERGQKLANVTLVPEHPLHSYIEEIP